MARFRKSDQGSPILHWLRHGSARYLLGAILLLALAWKLWPALIAAGDSESDYRLSVVGGMFMGILGMSGICLLLTGILRSRKRPPPPGHCTHCGYCLIGNVSGRCPECGLPVATGRHVPFE